MPFDPQGPGACGQSAQMGRGGSGLHPPTSSSPSFSQTVQASREFLELRDRVLGAQPQIWGKTPQQGRWVRPETAPGLRAPGTSYNAGISNMSFRADTLWLQCCFSYKNILICKKLPLIKKLHIFSNSASKQL